MPQLVVRTRSGRVESVHDGIICVTNSEGKIVNSLGNPEASVFLRSSGKPFIAVAFVKSGAMKKFDISLKELAIICSSHQGQAFHRRTVKSILAKIGLSEKDLDCGHKYPEDQKVHKALDFLGRRPTPIFNNCSGKHAGMLALCKYYNFPIKGYIKPDHPVQQLVRKTMAELLECDENNIIIGVDGCTMPTYLLTFHQASWLYARLAHGYKGKSKYNDCLGLINEAMTKYPRYIHGDDTPGTDLAYYSKGRVIGKIGAEGVFCISIPEKDLGICLKLSDGHPWASYPVVVGVLEELGILDKDTVKKLDKWALPAVTNDKGKKVGFVHPTFSILQNKTTQYEPGDIYPYGGK